MTREALAITPSYPINGVGPYQYNNPYTLGALRAFVELDDRLIALEPGEYVADPLSSNTSGSIALTTQAATAYDGGTLYMLRQTDIEQGFAGQSARENGLAAQLDWMTEAIQDVAREVSRSLRSTSSIVPGIIKPGRTVLFDENLNLIPGPTSVELEDVVENAQKSVTAAATAVASAALADERAIAATVQARISTTQAGVATTAASEAILAAKAAGANLVTSLTDPVPPNDSIELLQTGAGTQVHEVKTGAWVQIGWLGVPVFPTIPAMAEASGFIHGQYVDVELGENGQMERYAARLTGDEAALDADGALVVDAEGMGEDPATRGRMVSKRRVYADFAALKSDKRTYASLPVGTVVDYGFHKAEVQPVVLVSPDILTDGGIRLYVLKGADGLFNVGAFGAKIDGVTDDSLAVQVAHAAMLARGGGGGKGISSPAGTMVAAEIPLDGTNWTLAASGTKILNNLPGAKPTFVNAANHNCRRVTFNIGEVQNTGTGGDIFALDGGDLIGFDFYIDQLSQDTVDYKILTNENSGGTGRFFWGKFRGNNWECAAGNTANRLIEYIDSKNTCSEITFDIKDMRQLGSGRFFYFESTSASGIGSAFNGLSIIDAGVEKCQHGFATFLGCNMTKIDGLRLYDLGTDKDGDGQPDPIVEDLIVIGAGSGGTISGMSSLRNIQRTAGMLDPGVVDIRIGANQVRLDNVGGLRDGVGFTVDCGGFRVIATMAQQTTFLNTKWLTNLSDDYLSTRGLRIFPGNPARNLTIAAGVLTVPGPGHHVIYTEGSASTDDINTILGTEPGDIIIISPATGNDTVLKHNAGNLFFKGEADVTLANTNRALMMFHDPLSNKLVDLGA